MSISFQKSFYVFVILLTLASLIAISVTDVHLKNEVTNGIIDFELAKTPERARQIMDSWGHTGRLYAAFSLGIDYLFLVFYTLFFVLSTYKISRRNHRFFQNIAFFLTLVFVSAGVFDAVENYYLFQVLTHPDDTASNILAAYYFSSAKFILLGLGVLMLLAGWLTKRFYRQ